MIAPEKIQRAVRQTLAGVILEPLLFRNLYDEVMGAAEKQLLIDVLRHHRFNQCHAADHLGINRNTLRKLIRRHGIILGGGA